MHNYCVLMLDLREVGAVLGSTEHTEEPIEQRRAIGRAAI